MNDTPFLLLMLVHLPNYRWVRLGWLSSSFKRSSFPPVRTDPFPLRPVRNDGHGFFSFFLLLLFSFMAAAACSPTSTLLFVVF